MPKNLAGKGMLIGLMGLFSRKFSRLSDSIGRLARTIIRSCTHIKASLTLLYQSGAVSGENLWGLNHSSWLEIRMA